MIINQHKLLHYVLIILLMFAPLRGVIAMQMTQCDMDGDTVYSSTDMSDQSIMHDMSAMSMTGSHEQEATNSHDCCTGSDYCVTGCDMSLSATLLMNVSSYTPNFTSVTEPISLISNILVREFTPPFRPPLVFHT